MKRIAAEISASEVRVWSEGIRAMERERTFFLTGCASGIGRHMAGVLAERGHRVFATDINLEGLEASAAERGWLEPKVHLARLDVTDPDNWEEVFGRAVDALGGVDVIMNIAGYLQSGLVHEAPVKETNRHIDINAKGVVFGTQVAARHMVERGKGHIINISSIAGLVPVPGMALYSASKYFVRSYSLAAADELRPRGVAVTIVCPFSVQTPLLERQVTNPSADMMFAYPALTVQDIEQAIIRRALPKTPREVWIPRSRCWLARLVDVFPALAPWVAPYYVERGRAAKAKIPVPKTVES